MVLLYSGQELMLGELMDSGDEPTIILLNEHRIKLPSKFICHRRVQLSGVTEKLPRRVGASQIATHSWPGCREEVQWSATHGTCASHPAPEGWGGGTGEDRMERL